VTEATGPVCAEMPGPGAMLARGRSEKRLTVEDVSARLKFAPRQIKALEADEYDRLPGTTFVRGVIRSYARLLELDAAPLLKAWARNELHAVVVTSSEGLRNLFEMVGKLGQSWLAKTPLIVPHARIAETARGLGLTNIVVTEAGDEGILAGLCAHFGAAKGKSP